MAIHYKPPHTKVIGGSVNSQRPEVVCSTTNPPAAYNKIYIKKSK